MEKEIERQFAAVKKMVISDYPYPFEFKAEWIDLFKGVYLDVKRQHALIKNAYYRHQDENGKWVGDICLNYIDHYVILGFRYAHALYKAGFIEAADAVYYSYRVRGCLDLFYRAEIGDCFMPVHAIGADTDSKAKMGKGFRIYDKVKIGPYEIAGLNPSEWVHPSFGDYVTILANCSIYGNTTIGNNVIVASGTTIINEEIPDDCIVMGSSPNLFCKPMRTNNKDDFEI